MAPKIVVHSLPVCPNCERLKEYLKEHNLSFTERSLEDTDVLIDILYDSGIHVQEAPVILIGNEYYPSNQIFVGGKIDPNLFKDVI